MHQNPQGLPPPASARWLSAWTTACVAGCAITVRHDTHAEFYYESAKEIKRLHFLHPEKEDAATRILDETFPVYVQLFRECAQDALEGCAT